MIPHQFQIICSKTVIITEARDGWNIISLPFNQTINKNNLTILYNGTEYNWTQATTSDNIEGQPLLLNFMYDFSRTSQTYQFTDNLDPGYGNWIYAYYNFILKREISS